MTLLFVFNGKSITTVDRRIILVNFLEVIHLIDQIKILCSKLTNISNFVRLKSKFNKILIIRRLIRYKLLVYI
jgi:hypothetical protein